MTDKPEVFDVLPQQAFAGKERGAPFTQMIKLGDHISLMACPFRLARHSKRLVEELREQVAADKVRILEQEAILKELLNAFPLNRDWLDPTLEARMRDVIFDRGEHNGTDQTLT